MERIFPELKENVMQNHLIPIATMDGNKIVHITTTAMVNEYAKAIIENFQGKEMLILWIRCSVVQR
jgi:hypothetical protein